MFCAYYFLQFPFQHFNNFGIAGCRDCSSLRDPPPGCRVAWEDLPVWVPAMDYRRRIPRTRDSLALRGASIFQRVWRRRPSRRYALSWGVRGPATFVPAKPAIRWRCASIPRNIGFVADPSGVDIPAQIVDFLIAVKTSENMPAQPPQIVRFFGKVDGIEGGSPKRLAVGTNLVVTTEGLVNDNGPAQIRIWLTGSDILADVKYHIGPMLPSGLCKRQRPCPFVALFVIGNLDTGITI